MKAPSETDQQQRAFTMSERNYFGKIREVIDPPNLIEIQLNSYVEFLQTNLAASKRKETGLQAVFKEVFPITSYDEKVSLLAGTKASIQSADRQRRRLGGAMRQTGIFAAAALHGLDHHFARLREDHANARSFAERLAAGAPVLLDLATVQTNIVVFHLPPALAIDAPTLTARAREQGVLLNAFGPRTVRAVTHLDVNGAQCAQAAQVLVRLLTA